MRSIYLSTLLLLATGSALAAESTADDAQAAAEYYHGRVERLRTRAILEARARCQDTDCMTGGDGACVDAGCTNCAWNYYCTDPDDAKKVPKVDEMPVFVDASDIPQKPPILTNFIEPGQLNDGWANIICKEITKVASDQDKTAGKWHYGVQGTHKKLISLVHDKRYLDLLVTWEATDTRVLPMFDKEKVGLCKKALQEAAENTNQLQYGAFNSKSVLSIKNRQKVAIQTPKTKDRKNAKRGRNGNTIAFINIELGDHNKEVGLFNGNGLPS